MFRHLIKSIVLAMLVGAPAFAASTPPALLTAPEWNVETTTMVTSLPVRSPGSMTARSCMECKGVELQVTKDTQFMTDETAVTLAELRKAAQSRHNMMVFYNSKTREVTRIVVQGISQAKQVK